MMFSLTQSQEHISVNLHCWYTLIQMLMSAFSNYCECNCSRPSQVIKNVLMLADFWGER